MYPLRHRSRYVEALRRAHVARIAAVGAALAIPTACSNNDADTFAAATADVASSTTGEATTSSTGAPPSTPTEPTPTTALTTVPATDPATTVAAATAAPAGAEIQIDFTYRPESTAAPVRNPYIAVWIEDAGGNLVRTIAVWYQSSIPGPRWLGDLRQWNAVSGGAMEASFTGATRAPGTYSLVWDGTDDAGNPVADGDYVIWIESAREHGPYSSTSSAFRLSSDTSVTLPDSGELIGASATALG